MDTLSAYTVSLLLLVAEPFSDDVKFPDGNELVYLALKDHAHLLELYDRDGSSWGHFNNELRWVRANWRRWDCCPPVADACWLPPHAFCRDVVGFADRFVDHLDKLLPWTLRKEELRDVRTATLELRNIWWFAKEATEPGPGIIYRRKSLAALRDKIGADAYRRGELPPWVPYWFFDEGVGYDN